MTHNPLTCASPACARARAARMRRSCAGARRRWTALAASPARRAQLASGRLTGCWLSTWRCQAGSWGSHSARPQAPALQTRQLRPAAAVQWTPALAPAAAAPPPPPPPPRPAAAAAAASGVATSTAACPSCWRALRRRGRVTPAAQRLPTAQTSSGAGGHAGKLQRCVERCVDCAECAHARRTRGTADSSLRLCLRPAPPPGNTRGRMPLLRQTCRAGWTGWTSPWTRHHWSGACVGAQRRGVSTGACHCAHVHLRSERRRAARSCSRRAHHTPRNAAHTQGARRAARASAGRAAAAGAAALYELAPAAAGRRADVRGIGGGAAAGTGQPLRLAGACGWWYENWWSCGWVVCQRRGVGACRVTDSSLARRSHQQVARSKLKRAAAEGAAAAAAGAGVGTPPAAAADAPAAADSCSAAEGVTRTAVWVVRYCRLLWGAVSGAYGQQEAGLTLGYHFTEAAQVRACGLRPSQRTSGVWCGVVWCGGA
jgi:hypothetical protein